MEGTLENLCSEDQEKLIKWHLVDITNAILVKKRLLVFERDVQDEGTKVLILPAKHQIM